MPTLRGRGVWISVNPDASMFGIKTKKDVDKQIAGVRADIPVTADTKPAIASIEALKTRMRALNDKLATLRLTAEDKGAEATIAKTQAKLAALAKTMSGLVMSADDKKLDAQILAKIAEVKKLQQSMSSLKMNADDKALTAKIAGLMGQAARLKKSMDTGKLKITVAEAKARIESLQAQITLLKSNAKDGTLALSNASAMRNIAVTKAELASLQKQARDVRIGGGSVDTAGIMAAEAALLGLEAAFSKTSEESALAKTAMNAFFATSGRGSTFAAAGWKLLTGHITLFGGALNQVLPKMFTSVAVWHLLADAVIELVAVWAPAIIAVTAFGVAGADAAKSIYNRMVAVHTVMDATGRAVPPLTNNFKHLAASVKPEVYQLFGDALVVMGKRGSAFNTVATGTGRVLDQLAARFVVAVTSGSGVNKFMEHAVEDVAKLGDSIGNLGGIFGAVFKAVPGYAEILLTVGDAITKVLENFAQAAEPVIAFGLLLHGAVIYIGAAATASLALVASLVKVGAAFGKFNDKIVLVGVNNLKKFGSALTTAGLGIAGYGQGLLDVAGKEGKAAAGTRVLADAQKLLTKIPTTAWVLAAAAALALLVTAVIQSRDAAQKFNATLQETIQNAPLTSVVTTIQQAQVVTAARLADSTRKLNVAIKENTVVNAGRAGALNSNGTAIQNLDNASRHYREGLGQLTDQQKLVTGRFSDLSKAYGGNTAALGILNAAGITTAQITDKNKDHWAQALIQVDATAKAYAAMGTQAGVLGNDLDVLGRTVTDQAQAVKKLNEAWGQFIGDVTGTQGAFDTVAQGFFTLQDHSQKLTFSLGKLKVKYADQKAAIDSLTPAGIALNQAFGDQVVSIDKLFASWRTAGLASNLFTAGVKDAIAPLVKYATGSKEATAQLVALAEEAGYQGPISMKALVKWLGNTHGATQKLKDITNQATEQEALLTGAMQAQGDFIANQLIGDINNSILAYTGVKKAVTDYGTALARAGKGSDAANKAMTRAIGALVASGLAMGDNAQTIGALVAKVFGISMPAAMKKVQQAIGTMVAGLPPAQKKFEQFAISGLAMTRGEADKLWKKFSETNLGALAAKADTTRDKFDKLASKGLGITRDQADLLWKHLRMQYLDTLAQKGDITRSAFIKLAEKGLDLTRNAAQRLWDTLHKQQLIDMANKAGTTRSAFEKLASQLGVTKGYADRLWSSLHRVASGSPYGVTFITTGKGKGGINFATSGPFLPRGTSNITFKAAGGRVNMGSGPTSDDVPAMLSRGEVVVPTKMVNAGAVDHLRGSLPGFYAKGGQVPGFAQGGQALTPARADEMVASLHSATPWGEALAGKAIIDASEWAMRTATAWAKAQFEAALAAAGGSGSGIVGYARSFLGKIPYKFGGTTLQGMDCSGFTGMVYRHAGYSNIPRTSEGQGLWVQRTKTPQAGGLAFYHSPAGGPDPGHVAIIDRGGNGIISQGGGMGPKLEGLHALPLLWTGVPPGGFPKAPTGGSIGGKTPAAAQAWMRGHLSDYGWGGAQWGPLLSLWNQESGWRWNATNPSSGAYGIPQSLPASKMASAGADWGTNPVTQMRWGAGYIRSVYGNPAAAWSHEMRSNWYGEGGMVPEYADGGLVPGYASGGVAGLRSKLAGEQRNEQAKYSGLRHAFLAGPAKYRTKTVVGELATLARRQSAELDAYAALAGSGLTTTRMHHLGATARAERIVASDQGLSRLPGGHPKWAADLRKYLGQISTTASGSVPAGSTSGGGGGTVKPPAGGGGLNATQIARQGQTYLNAWRSRRGGGFGAAWGPIVLNEQIPEMQKAISRATVLSKAGGLSAAKHRFWANAAADEKKRLAVLKKELTIERGWRGQLGSADVTLGKQIAAARGLPSLAKNVAAWKKQVTAHEYTIGQISKMLGYSNAYIKAHPPAPVLPKVVHSYGGDVSDLLGAFISSVAPFAMGGMAGMARGGMMQSFDSGGTLSPGFNPVWNGTGRDEHLVPAGQGASVIFQVSPSGNAFDQFLTAWLKKNVRVKGGGSAQKAWGTH